MTENPFTHDQCPVCDSPYRAYLRDIWVGRTQRTVPLYVCLQCRSFTCAAGYTEDDAALECGAKCNLNHLEQKTRDYGWLVNQLKPFVGVGGRFADIGCALGTMVDAAGKAGYDAYGFDINAKAIDEAKKQYPHLTEKLFAQPFSRMGSGFRVATAIDVMEHLAQPRAFMVEVAKSIIFDGWFYVTVPRLDRDKWNWLSQPIAEQKDPNPINSPFYDCDVHVTHYSTEGLMKLGVDFGLQPVQNFTKTGWPLNGILFQRKR